MALSPEKLAHFEAIGPDGVLLEMAAGKHGQAPDSRNWIEATTWVDSEKLRISNELEAKRGEREERMLAISSSALEIAKESASSASRAAIAAERQARYAMYAAIIAVVAVITDTNELIKELIAYLQKK